nr:MAG TPA: hypothetical protein [Caudoviricetes sp.]
MGDEKAKIDLTGKWQVRRQFSVNAVAERDLKIFGDRECVVEFADAGILTELSAGDKLTCVYSFDPDFKTISIHAAAGESASAIAGNSYRVIPLNDREMYFMTPPSIDADAYAFEITLLERI